jgi:hypothetical protein
LAESVCPSVFAGDGGDAHGLRDEEGRGEEELTGSGCDAVHFVFEGCVEEVLDGFKIGWHWIGSEPARVAECEEEGERHGRF